MCKKIVSTFLSLVIALSTIFSFNVFAEESGQDINSEQPDAVVQELAPETAIVQDSISDLNEVSVGLYRYDNVQRITNTFYIQNGVANITSDVVGKSGTTRLEVTSELQYNGYGSWDTFTSFSDSSNSARLVLSETTGVPQSNYRYRVACTVTAYMGSTSETVTVYSNECRY